MAKIALAVSSRLIRPIHEEWKPVPVIGYGFVYSISSRGRVRRDLSRDGRSVSRILSLSINRGYPEVSLWHRGVVLRVRVHSLVCLAFHGPAPGPVGRGRGFWQVDHIDRNRSNNCWRNVRWLLSQDNAKRGNHKRGDDHWTRKRPDRVRRGMDYHGTRNPNAKLSARQVQAIRGLLMQTPKIKRSAIAERFGVSLPTIEKINSGETWKDRPNAIVAAYPVDPV